MEEDGNDDDNDDEDEDEDENDDDDDDDDDEWCPAKELRFGFLLTPYSSYLFVKSRKAAELVCRISRGARRGMDAA